MRSLSAVYLRLVVLVLAFEVLLSAVIGLGIYAGFSVFPYAQAAGQTPGINATVPMYMPTLTDLKASYTFFEAGPAQWGALSILASIALVVLQSFVRGMYLGGIKAHIQGRRVSLVACGRRYFGVLFGFACLQIAAGLLAMLFAMMFFLFGFLAMAAMLAFALAPYLAVLQELPLGEAIARSPRILRRYVGEWLPLAVGALMCTVVISFFRGLPEPWSYPVPLVVYVVVGTLLIAGLMRSLDVRLRAEGEAVPPLLLPEKKERRIAVYGWAALVPALVAAGVFVSSGKHLNALDFGGKERLAGMAYGTNFSDAFYASDRQFTTYWWASGEWRIAMRLPDLSTGDGPKELRGIADIRWSVDELVNTRVGTGTTIEMRPVQRESKLMYQLVRDTASDGTPVYSSMNGGQVILMPGKASPIQPFSFHLAVSGDGRDISLLQYQRGMDEQLLFRMSEDGRYILPGTSTSNPQNVKVYWFSDEHRTEDVFALMEARNRINLMPKTARAYMTLAAALQQGDGRMVADLLQMLRQQGVTVTAPERDAAEWSAELKRLYAHASLGEVLLYIAKAGEQDAYVPEEQPGGDAKRRVYRIEVPFPGGPIPLEYEETEDGLLIAIKVG
ncbi:hypothetical protein [Paenibacillus methanolicus]|uniref:Uncharacterized protein n=1 Tax=Paenibacillus methanolicus TaxID=582686 RepID=A0A5S5C5U2_9BACL|nr:hypothetical protein [Paenibacillus methanolicus]TYP74687.1 hypothetical protein BCM02_105231 [Paenibacillus methanolicus]